MTVALTKKQKEALDFIREHVTAHGIAPTFTEIGAALGLKSKSGVARIVVGLVERGAVTHIPKHARSIAIIDGAPLPFFTAELRWYCRRADKPIIDVIGEAVREYIAAHPLPGETA